MRLSCFLLFIDFQNFGFQRSSLNSGFDSRELLDYLGDLVDQRVAKPLDDLISKLVVEQVRGVVCGALRLIGSFG